VEEAIRTGGSAELDAYEIGLAILGPLRELDEVAYLRFASVYQAFDSLEDFESAITSLREEREEREVVQGESAQTGTEQEDLRASLER
jgi:transcriptional repressor NrdR